MAQLGRPVRGSEEDVESVIACVRCQFGVAAEINQDWKGGEVGGHLGGIDGDLLAVLPTGVVPSRRQLAEVHVQGVGTGGDGGVVVAGGVGDIGVPVGVLTGGVEGLGTVPRTQGRIGVLAGG